jgi:hypothetical protein
MPSIPIEAGAKSIKALATWRECNVEIGTALYSGFLSQPF